MLLYTAMVHASYPHKTGELLVYIANLLQTSLSYPIDTCLVYNQVFRAQAHLKPSFDWSSNNTRLWNNKFSGKAKPCPCSKCKSTLHSSADCSQSSPTKQQSSTAQTKEKSSEVCMGFSLTEKLLFTHYTSWNTLIGVCLPVIVSPSCRGRYGRDLLRRRQYVPALLCVVIHSHNASR